MAKKKTMIKCPVVQFTFSNIGSTLINFNSKNSTINFSVYQIHFNLFYIFLLYFNYKIPLKYLMN